MGATVILTLPQRQPVPAPALWSVEGPRRGAIGLTVVGALAAIGAFAIQFRAFPAPGPQAAALALVLLLDALTVATLVRQRRLPGWLSALLIARIAAVLMISGFALPGCTSMGYALFAGGSQVITCVVITLLRPWREALTALASYATGYFGVAIPLYAAGETCGITALNQTGTVLGYTIAGIWFVRALHRHARIAAEVLTAEEELLAARTAREVRTAERRRLLPVIRGIVTDTLTGLVEGRLDPATFPGSATVPA
jgi:hypothetical protein